MPVIDVANSVEWITSNGKNFRIMKASFEREKLLAAFQLAASVAPQRSPKLILQNIKLDVSSAGAIVMATDLEVGIRANVEGADVQTPGSVVLHVARMGSILRESNDPQVYIESDPKGTLVRGQRSEFRLPSDNPSEFPDIAEFNDGKYHQLPARALRELINRTIFATDNESSRYALGGVLIELHADKLIGVGTDGRRLAKMEVAAQSVGGADSPDAMTIVPSKAMQLMMRALADGDEEVRLAARANEAIVKSSRVTIYSRLVEGRFPRWRDVFPDRHDVTKIDLPIGPLYSAVRQAAIVTTEDSRGVDFTFGDGSLVLTGRAAEVGQSRIELPVSYDGPSISIALDPRYVSDFLRVLEPEKTFTLELKDSESAAVCHTDDGYGYVIMPLARDQR